MTRLAIEIHSATPEEAILYVNGRRYVFADKRGRISCIEKPPYREQWLVSADWVKVVETAVQSILTARQDLRRKNEIAAKLGLRGD